MGWEHTSSLGLHHLGDVIGPSRRGVIEVKTDSAAASTGNLCFEMVDLAPNWSGSQPQGSLASDPSAPLVAKVTGVKKTSWLALQHGLRVVYVHFVGDSLEQGYVYGSDDAVNWVLRPSRDKRWLAWSSASNRGNDPMTMATAGILVPTSDVLNFGYRFDSLAQVRGLAIEVLRRDLRLSPREFARHSIHADMLPRILKVGGRLLTPSSITMAGPKCGLDPYPNLVGS